jgi:3'-phosphoadenosine 5'-phosphosulfate sulfotransferase (PAPS reductase)/FAD synthetase
MKHNPETADSTASAPASRENAQGVGVGVGEKLPSVLMPQFEMFDVERPSPAQIVEKALAHNPVAIFAMFSGGDGSLGTTHWAMNNVPDCEVLHINTGIGIERTRTFVRETCEREGWPLTEMRAKEDCGQDYDEIVSKHGFPGPKSHQYMYARLKERCVELIVRRRKTKRSDKVMLMTGICHDDSVRRSGYGGREVNFKGAQMWVNPMYWAGSSFLHHYVRERDIPRNPVSIELGMSGECMCGAFAQPGELKIVRRVCPATAARIDALQHRISNRHSWGWEQAPPKDRDTQTIEMFSPMCVNCLKSERLAA